MSGVSGLLNIAKSAILAQQAGMNVVSHNIANANTEGYSKQEIQFTSRPGILMADKILGKGVEAGRVRQRQSEFADRRIQQELNQVGNFETSRRTLEQIETLFTGVGESDLNARLNNFFNAWEDLSSNPESMAFRSQLVQRTNSLTDKFHSMDEGFAQVRSNINAEVRSTVSEVNSILNQVFDLNQNIEHAESNGNSANDLRDQRSLLIKDLSRKMGVEVQENQSGAVQISYGGILLVDSSNRIQLTTQATSKNGGNYTRIFAGDREIETPNGELGGLLQTRDVNLQGYQDQLDTLASSLMKNINEAHSQGFDLNGNTGINFFTSSMNKASNIEINKDILGDLSMISGAGGTHDWVNDVHTSNGLGDNSIALRIANLRNVKLLQDRTTTFNDYYNTMYSDVGFDTNEAKQGEESHTLLQNQMENYRDSIVGVSIDEEMADMMKFQHSYTAAARLVSVANDMMTTLINLVG